MLVGDNSVLIQLEMVGEKPMVDEKSTVDTQSLRILHGKWRMFPQRVLSWDRPGRLLEEGTDSPWIWEGSLTRVSSWDRPGRALR